MFMAFDYDSNGFFCMPIFVSVVVLLFAMNRHPELSRELMREIHKYYIAHTGNNNTNYSAAVLFFFTDMFKKIVLNVQSVKNLLFFFHVVCSSCRSKNSQNEIRMPKKFQTEKFQTD